MLDFTSDENLLMLEIMELSPNHLSYVQGQQQYAYEVLGDALLTRVRSLLEEYSVLDENDAISGSELKSGMKRLDVIEWFGPSETNNRLSTDRLFKIKSKLINVLNITLVSKVYQGTPMYKG